MYNNGFLRCCCRTCVWLSVRYDRTDVRRGLMFVDFSMFCVCFDGWNNNVIMNNDDLDTYKSLFTAKSPKTDEQISFYGLF